jgi:hypothetical protein
MRSIWERIVFVLVAISLTASISLGGSGYLARVGPSPLRFAIVPARLDPATALPPLTPPEEIVTTTTPSTNLTTSMEFGPQPLSASLNSTNSPGEILIGPEPLDSSNSTQAPSELPAQTGISPQMLLRYFNRPGTREALISAPLEFTPPTPNANSGSSATYISPP